MNDSINDYFKSTHEEIHFLKKQQFKFANYNILLQGGLLFFINFIKETQYFKIFQVIALIVSFFIMIYTVYYIASLQISLRTVRSIQNDLIAKQPKELNEIISKYRDAKGNITSVCYDLKTLIPLFLVCIISCIVTFIIIIFTKQTSVVKNVSSNDIYGMLNIIGLFIIALGILSIFIFIILFGKSTIEPKIIFKIIDQLSKADKVKIAKYKKNNKMKILFFVICLLSILAGLIMVIM